MFKVDWPNDNQQKLCKTNTKIYKSDSITIKEIEYIV